MTSTDASRRRRRWPWLVALLVVAGLLVAAWFLADSVARDVATSAVRTAVIQKLRLPADQKVDVDIEGMVIPQLIEGTFHDVRVASDGVPVGGTTADVTVRLNDIEYRGDTPGKMASGSAVVTVGQQQLRSLLDGADGIPASSLVLRAPHVTASTKVTVFGTAVPIGIAMTPTAKAGALVLRPDSFTVGSARMTAAALSGRFGSLVDGITRSRSVCIANRLPAGVSLTAVKVSGASLVADLAIDGDLAVDSALQQKGSCS
ncbi:MAG TPA: LmeA family phospholipid-binding protein [Microbacterium sp.]|uniref:LmeA family phospholipid-binding protein n=1 Tax=Microbacterium sp. TaxID=51671 RepID=UPI002B45C11C|nr:LmeA family phospholipid-binding protein [Microbacterium sp.]HKT57172.1 LmeA family phospholipid-binding protein [Microbacterium sp.]